MTARSFIPSFAPAYAPAYSPTQGRNGEGADPNEGYDVFAIPAQSNGIGRYGPIDPVLDATDSDIFMLQRSTGLAVTAQDPLDHIGETANTVGFGLTFAKQYKADGQLTGNRKILLVCCGQGSTGFNASEWNIGGTNYQDVIDQVATAMALDLNGGVNRFKGFLWHQGEAEGGISEATYRNRMHTIAVMYRSLVTGASSTTPWICGQLVPTSSAAGVQAAIINVGSTLPYSAGISSTGLTDGGDGLHFDATSQRTFGQRYYTGYDTGLSGDLSITAPAAPTLAATDGDPGQTTLTITEGDLGGSATRHVLVEYKLSSESTWTDFNRTADPSLSLDLTGLTNGEEYNIRVRIVTSGGISSYSNTETITPEASSIELSADFVHDWSATQTDSYNGSGETWTDRKGNQDMWLGADGTTDGTEPTFDGTAGDPAARFLVNGDYFNAKANSTVLSGMHRSDGGAFTWAMTVDLGAGDLECIGTGAIGASAGFVIEIIRSSRQIRFRCLDSAGSSVVTKEITNNPGGQIGTGLTSLCFGYDPTSGDWAMKIQSDTFVSGTTTASTTTDATPNTFKIGRNGDASVSGTNLDYVHEFGVANKLLNETEMDAAITALLARRA